MIILTLEEIKRHLRWPDTEPDSEEDPYLEDLEAAAVSYVRNYLNRDVPYPADDEHSDPWIPPCIRQSLLIIIGDMYENRQDNIVGTIVGRIGFVHDIMHFERIGLGI